MQMLYDAFEGDPSVLSFVLRSARWNRLDSLAFLVDNSSSRAAILETRTSCGWTPAHAAAIDDNPDVLGFIVRNAPSGDAVLDVGERTRRETPYVFANKFKFYKVPKCFKLHVSRQPRPSFSFSSSSMSAGSCCRHDGNRYRVLLP